MVFLGNKEENKVLADKWYSGTRGTRQITQSLDSNNKM